MVKVDNGKCIGCGACASTCPDGFEMKDVNGEMKAVVKDSNASCVKEAIETCPVDAIS
jgi:ferredoxin